MKYTIRKYEIENGGIPGIPFSIDLPFNSEVISFGSDGKCAFILTKENDWATTRETRQFVPIVGTGEIEVEDGYQLIHVSTLYVNGYSLSLFEIFKLQ